MAVMLVTSVGELVIDLFTEQCPLATKNFLKLCKIKYYNNCLFHSVQKDFIAQTGDPTGTGKGGDSIYKLLYGDQARFFDDEIHPTLKHDKVGVVAMASAGENANASQFYITIRAELDYLDEKHTVFGEVGEGLDTLMRINEAFVDDNFRPYKNIRIKHAIILEDPFDDPAGLADLIPDRSPELKPPAEGEEVRLEDDWVAMDETMDPEEIEKSLLKKEAQSRAVVLEMIGDLPEADMKPPENVLFVCKLNSVTEEGDLELIFGRFGKVKSADIIRDFKTGDSLCYAFIEFETEEACEAAYFKMDNVLIDDRRIHVDFSQSVSHLWNRYRKLGKTGGDGQSANQGKGCFKCGEVGHFAKECPNNGADQNEGPTEKPKYTIKDTGGQRGIANKRYDMVFDDDADETPQEKKVADKLGDGRHKFARGTEEERRRGGQEDRDDRREYHDRSRQGRRHDKDRGVHHREHGSGYHSRPEREFESSRPDRDTDRRIKREFERSRVDRNTITRTDREFDKPRASRDTNRTREFDKAAVERDTDRRNERNFEKSRSDKDGSRRDERDVSRQVDRHASSPRATERVRPESKSRREEEIPRENTRTRDTEFEDQRRDKERDSFRRPIDDSGGREKRSRRSGDRDVAQIESRAHDRDNKSAEASRESYGEKRRRYRRSGRESSQDIEDNDYPSGDLYDKAGKTAKDSSRRNTERGDIGGRERGNDSYHKDDDTRSRRRR